MLVFRFKSNARNIERKKQTMDIKNFTITDECIGCMACVGITEEIFQIGEDGKAFVVRQPESKDEESLALEAMEACPVDAIKIIKKRALLDRPILARDNVKEVLDKFPELKEVLLKLSPKFKRLQNPLMYNTLARHVNFGEAAKITGVSLCELLHAINKFLGTEQMLIDSAPDCITEQEKAMDIGEEITWEEAGPLYLMTEENQQEIIEKILWLVPESNMVVISRERPDLLLKVVKSQGFKYNLQRGKEYRLSIFNPEKQQKDWREKKHKFEVLDVRLFRTDPFDVIIKKAYELQPGEGFVLVQTFEPVPLIRMLSELGFEYEVEHVSNYEVRVYFYKKEEVTSQVVRGSTEKPEVVIQSATPVAYPVIMRLLQSQRLQSAIKIKGLKVWEETEKHLGWIVNGKADISFSAVITSNKLRNLDVVFPAVIVWDNFVLLARGYKLNSLEDLIGRKIYLPLFEEAPPAKILKYLIVSKGLSLEQFSFKYGRPFGRPEQIFADLVLGKIDTAVLREPEASFAVKIMHDQGIEFSELRFDRLWNEINPGFGQFPNAGVVIKGEFVRKYPEIVELFLEELRSAVDWVVNNKEEAARLAFDIMRQPYDRVRIFLDRVNFRYVDGEDLREKVRKYFEVLVGGGILEAEIDEGFIRRFG